jgi:hypothetical protein
MSYIFENGGSISKSLVRKIPRRVIENAKNSNLVPVVDLMVFRLYPGFKPFFPDYDGNPKSVDWHISNDKDQQEIFMSVSSNENGINNTMFGEHTLLDGQMLLTSSSTPRKETPAVNRGWRLMMRVRFVPKDSNLTPKLLSQQYVDPGSEDAGW